MTCGTPGIVYHGGLLNTRVFHFDPTEQKPGLPNNIAALVHKVAPVSDGQTAGRPLRPDTLHYARLHLRTLAGRYITLRATTPHYATGSPFFRWSHCCLLATPRFASLPAVIAVDTEPIGLGGYQPGLHRRSRTPQANYPGWRLLRAQLHFRDLLGNWGEWCGTQTIIGKPKSCSPNRHTIHTR